MDHCIIIQNRNLWSVSNYVHGWDVYKKHFFYLLINNFDFHLYTELSQLDEELVYMYFLLGGEEPTKILEENGKKNCLCAKIICCATAHFSRAPPPSHFLKILNALHLKILILSRLFKNLL